MSDTRKDNPKYLRDFSFWRNKDISPRDMSDIAEFSLVQDHISDKTKFTEDGARKLYEEVYRPNEEYMPDDITRADASLEEKGVAALIFDTGCSSSNAWAWHEPNWYLYFKTPFVKVGSTEK